MGDVGRPVEWTEERKKAACIEIFQRIAEGESCREIMSKDRGDNLPSHRVFIEWLAESGELSKHYARMCEIRADLIFEETLEIADDSNEDITYKDGVAIENQKVVQRDRLRVETRKWFLSKLHPKKYGDKSEIDLRVKENVQPVINFIKNGSD